jgi:hypothetical protein
MSNAKIINDQNLAPIINEDGDGCFSIQGGNICSSDIVPLKGDVVAEDEIEEKEEKENIEVPPGSFGIDPNDEIPDEDIRQMLFLFCVNENIPIHYKQLLGKIIKKETYKKSEKLFMFNMIGYVWQKAKQEEDLTTTQKVIIVRRIHKTIFGKFDDQ